MGKTAVVTGGSRGIGKAIALKLAKEGYDIALNYASNDEAAKVQMVGEDPPVSGGRRPSGNAVCLAVPEDLCRRTERL